MVIYQPLPQVKISLYFYQCNFDIYVYAQQITLHKEVGHPSLVKVKKSLARGGGLFLLRLHIEANESTFSPISSSLYFIVVSIANAMFG